MKKQLLLMCMTLVTAGLIAQCPAVTSINENFDDWQGNEVEPCWSTIKNGTLIYPNNGGVTFYTSNSAGVNMYLITPEIESLGNSYNVSLNAQVTGPLPGLTMEIGTITNPSDTTTFTAISETPVPLIPASQDFSFSVPESTDKYVAVKITGVSAHSAARIDNFMLAKTLSTQDFRDYNTTVSVYPNPTTNSFRINQPVNTVNIYNIIGKRVKTFSGNYNANHPFLISELTNGMYIIEATYNSRKKITTKLLKH